MRTKLSLLSIFLIFLFSTAFAAMPYNEYPAANSEYISALTLKPHDIEKLIGRRLTLKEKITLKVAQWKLRKELKKTGFVPDDTNSKAEKMAQTAIFGGIGAWLFALLSLAVPIAGFFTFPLALAGVLFGAASLGKTKNKTKSLIGLILGGAFLLIVLVGILSVV